MAARAKKARKGKKLAGGARHSAGLLDGWQGAALPPALGPWSPRPMAANSAAAVQEVLGLWLLQQPGGAPAADRGAAARLLEAGLARVVQVILTPPSVLH